MADVTKAPMPLVVDGVEYLMTPFIDRDEVELDKWLRSTIVKVATEASEDMSPDDRDLIMSAAVREARATSWRDPRARRYFQNFEGLGRIVYLSLRHRHPKVTHEQCVAWCQRKDVVDQFNVLFRMNNGLPEPTVDGKSDTSENGAQKSDPTQTARSDTES